MKVSIEGILGSARKINSQKELDGDSSNKKKQDVKIDSVSISNSINSRLDSIESDFREIQTSLTRNQIIRDGIQQLQNNVRQGGQGIQQILTTVQYEGQPVLRNFIGEDISENALTEKMNNNSTLINNDINRLKRLQVELDNFMASDLAGSEKVEGVMSNINSLFANTDIARMESLTSLNADSVMKLIK